MISAQSAAMIVLRRGDRVLVTMVEDPEAEDAAQYLDFLTKSFPGVEFVLLGGVAAVAVLPGEPTAKELTS